MEILLSNEKSAFITGFSAFARNYGLPGNAAKILGFLLICKPARQTAKSVQANLRLSVGGTNTGLALLVALGMVERTKAEDSKRYHYEIRPADFQRAILGRLQSARESRQLAEKGLKIDHANARLAAMRDVFGLIEQELPRIIEKLKAEA